MHAHRFLPTNFRCHFRIGPAKDQLVAMENNIRFAMFCIIFTVVSYTMNKQAEKVVAELKSRLPSKEQEEDQME